MQNLFALLIAVSGIVLTGCGSAPTAVSPAVSDAGTRTLQEWYYPDSLIMPPGTTRESAVHGETAPSTEHLVLANLSGKETTATLTYYFEEDAPVQRVRKVPPRTSTIYRLNKLPDGETFPRGKLFGVKIVSDGPILPQPTRGIKETAKPGLFPGMNEFSTIAYPGPLGKNETKWVYADGHPKKNDDPKGTSDYEWITILNPNQAKDASVRITFNLNNGEQKLHTLIVPAERVRTVALHDLPLPKMTTTDAFYPVVESDIPVVVEQIRRPAFNADRAPWGGWGLIAFPVGNLPIDVPVLRP